MCYGCPSEDLNCFVNRLYKRAVHFANGEMLQRKLTYEDIHFFPQNWSALFLKV